MRRRYENGGDKKPGVFRRLLNQLKANRISRKDRKLTDEEKDRIENPEKYFQPTEKIDYDSPEIKLDVEKLRKPIYFGPGFTDSKHITNEETMFPINKAAGYLYNMDEYYRASMLDPNSLAYKRLSGEMLYKTKK